MFTHDDIKGLLSRIENDISEALDNRCTEFSFNFKVSLDEAAKYGFNAEYVYVPKENK